MTDKTIVKKLTDNRFFIFNSNEKDAVLNYYNEKTEELKRSGYISYGRYNDFYVQINSLLEKSPIHKAIVRTKIDMISGNGLTVENADALSTDFLFNKYSKEDVEKVIQRFSEDLTIYGGAALKIYRSNDRTKIAKVEYIPVYNLRWTTNRKKLVYSDDWFIRSDRYEYELFDVDSDEAQSILLFDNTMSNMSSYPRPDYLPAIDYIITEEYVASHHKNNANNGWFPSGILNFPYLPSADEIDETINRLKKQYQSAKNSGTVMVTFSEPGGTGVSFTPISSNNNDEKFLGLLDKLEEKILQGHQINSPVIVGIKTGSSVISNGEEILNALSVFQATYVNPIQKKIEDIFNDLLRYNGSNAKIKLNKYNISLHKKVDSAAVINILTNANLSLDTKRELLKIEGVSEEQIKNMLV